MGAKKWERYLWEDLHIVPVADFNKGRVNLLDIFVQHGRSYRLRNIVGASDGKPFRRRALKRIGSMLTLGDTNVEGWNEELIQELSDQMLALRDVNDDIRDEPFSKGSDGPDRKFSVGADSKVTTKLFGFLEGSFDKHGTLNIRICTPTYERIEEDDLVDFINGDSPKWKPDLRRIGEVMTKGTSFWGIEEEDLELWIVTELKFGTFDYTYSKGGGVGASVAIPGAEVATLLPAAVGANVSTSDARSREIDTPANQGDILYGLKAVRVKYDKKGNYVCYKGGDMGQIAAHVTRGDDDDLNPDKHPEYHMSAFIDSGNSGSDDFECVELVLDDDSEEDDTITDTTTDTPAAEP